ncbi:proline racemase family protein [Thermanaeromonas sp.]
MGGIKAVVPEITGQAWITGFSQFTISADDPLKYGFLLEPSAGER